MDDESGDDNGDEQMRSTECPSSFALYSMSSLFICLYLAVISINEVIHSIDDSVK